MYVQRKDLTSHFRGWSGPGVVVTINAKCSRVWVAMRGRLPQCSMEQERMASMEGLCGVGAREKACDGTLLHIWTELVNAEVWMSRRNANPTRERIHLSRSSCQTWNRFWKSLNMRHLENHSRAKRQPRAEASKAVREP